MSQPSFAEAVAQTLHVCWQYRLKGGEESRVVFPTGATRDEALAELEKRFPHRPVLYLKPSGGGR